MKLVLRITNEKKPINPIPFNIETFTLPENDKWVERIVHSIEIESLQDLFTISKVTECEVVVQSFYENDGYYNGMVFDGIVEIANDWRE